MSAYAHSVVTLNFASAATCLNLEMPGIEGDGGKMSSGRRRYGWSTPCGDEDRLSWAANRADDLPSVAGAGEEG